MYLTRLLYVSDRDQEKHFSVEQLLESARHFNVKVQVTGALWFNGDHFIQVLEGGRHAVSTTYHRIAADDRHRNIELVDCRVVSERLFYDWSMAYFSDTRANRNRILRFSGKDQLAPREMSPESLLGLMMSMQVDDDTTL